MRSVATSSYAAISLGRDAIEVTLVVRDLVRDRGCRLYDYVTGQEVQFANATCACHPHAMFRASPASPRQHRVRRLLPAAANRPLSPAA